MGPLFSVKKRASLSSEASEGEMYPELGANRHEVAKGTTTISKCTTVKVFIIVASGEGK